MNKIILLASVVCLMGCAHQDAWTTGDTVWEGIYIATLVADAHMTAEIQNHPNIREAGTIAKHALGQNPGTGETWLYMTTVGISHYLIARALPRGWRTFWQVGGIYNHGTAVNHGNQIGLFGEPCTRNQEEHPC